MTRASELFAIAAIMLLTVGVVLRRLPIVASAAITVHFRDTGYAFPPQAWAFSLGALFAVFAFVYCLWMVRLNDHAALWHFWLSLVGALLLAIGIVATALVSTQRTALITAVVGTFAGLAILVGAQAVFVANLLFTVFRRSRTP